MDSTIIIIELQGGVVLDAWPFSTQELAYTKFRALAFVYLAEAENDPDQFFIGQMRAAATIDELTAQFDEHTLDEIIYDVSQFVSSNDYELRWFSNHKTDDVDGQSNQSLM